VLLGRYLHDFKDDGFTLRQVRCDSPRRTELFIAMTMYNKDKELFTRSMHGVIKNVAHLCKQDRSKTWDKKAGRRWSFASSATVDPRSTRGRSVSLPPWVLPGRRCKDQNRERDVKAHVYEYTTRISVTPALKVENSDKGVVPEREKYQFTPLVLQRFRAAQRLCPPRC
jgi:chitin synthase